jgi:hypothetical protein
VPKTQQMAIQRFIAMAPGPFDVTITPFD